MFSRSKDKIDELYPSLQEYFNIKDDRELKKIHCNGGVPLPICLNTSKAALPNPKDPQHDLRHEKIKRYANPYS